MPRKTTQVKFKTNKEYFDSLPENSEDYVKKKIKYGNNKIRYLLEGNLLTERDENIKDKNKIELDWSIDLSPLKYKKLIDNGYYRIIDGAKYILESKLPNNLKNMSSNTINNKKKQDNMPNNQLIPHPILNKESAVPLYLTASQAKKAKYGHSFIIKPEQINPTNPNFRFTYMGRHNRALLHEALNSGKKARIVLMDEELGGSGIKEFFRGVGKFFKDNWGSIKPIVSTVLDLGAPALAKAFPEASPAILAGRQLIKKTTGVSVGAKATQSGGSFKAKGLRQQVDFPRRKMTGGRLVKGSAEAKAHMARIRAMRKTGVKKVAFSKVSVMDAGSFLSN